MKRSRSDDVGVVIVEAMVVKHFTRYVMRVIMIMMMILLIAISNRKNKNSIYNAAAAAAADYNDGHDDDYGVRDLIVLVHVNKTF